MALYHYESFFNAGSDYLLFSRKTQQIWKWETGLTIWWLRYHIFRLISCWDFKTALYSTRSYITMNPFHICSLSRNLCLKALPHSGQGRGLRSPWTISIWHMISCIRLKVLWHWEQVNDLASLWTSFMCRLRYDFLLKSHWYWGQINGLSLCDFSYANLTCIVI